MDHIELTKVLESFVRINYHNEPIILITNESYTLGSDELDPVLTPTWLFPKLADLVAIDTVNTTILKDDVTAIAFFSEDRSVFYGTEVLVNKHIGTSTEFKGA